VKAVSRKNKIRVGVLCGGRSGEHEVSLQSARNIVDAIDKEKYEVVLIGIDKNGQWALFDPSNFLIHPDDPKRIRLSHSKDRLLLDPGGDQGVLIDRTRSRTLEPIEVVFPVLHGPLGEDGTVQGLLKVANLPFVGAGVLGSAVGMDKDVTKRLLREAEISTPKFLVFQRSQTKEIRFDSLKNRLGLPFFVKPANYGSSIGVNKVTDSKRLRDAVSEAFQFDRKIVVEEFIEGREIECSVLGNDRPIASIPGEIVPRKVFYTYEAKYIDEDGAYLKVPADLEAPLVSEIQALAVKAFKALCCEGMARVDFFLRRNNEILVNEINTIPGFTKISMYPRLWKESGIPYPELIDRLIQLALQRFKEDSKLKLSYQG
jgi:D-alanine-D-alanine ligase